MVLDIGSNHLFIEPLEAIKDLGILNFLSLEDNLYTEIPNLSNILLFELSIDKNKLRYVTYFMTLDQWISQIYCHP
jgi:uncharacterized membrane protein YqhA